MIKDYLIQNWSLILILAAFSISLKTTVFLDKRTTRRLLILNVVVFLLSIVVFVEFYIAGVAKYREARTVLMGIRYSGTGYLSSAMAMDKGISKQMFRLNHVPVPEGFVKRNGASPPGKTDAGGG